MLYTQGEQLTRVEAGLDTINSEVGHPDCSTTSLGSDEGGRQGPDWHGEVVWPVCLSLEQVK